MTQRFVAIGVHLPRERADGPPGVEWLRTDELDFSAISFDGERGTAAPDVIRRALAARSALTADETFIAIRYGLTVDSPVQLREKCAGSLAAWRARLETTQGLVELTLKVAPADHDARERPDRKDFVSGRLYLEALASHRTAAPVDVRFSEAIERLFARHLREGKWLSRADGGHEYVMLAMRNRCEDIRDAALQLKSDQPQVPFLLSGPWPLEEFANAE